MTEQVSPKLVLTVDKSKVKFDGDFAIVDTGLTIEEFVSSIMEFATSSHETMAVMKEDGEE